ncbi:hypothetical protein HMPREF1978_00313 [Actinomyces graevenitzii F0530]|uniref:Uncharacterized protein n=1 Tax=Actinomyces graevenitzii F0530 TaxID=1321817 RepID=U1Q7P5_9ACTO|nr:hypothetical protein HMPREF1978_00313 [Actinomyces graevenitzii F0530]
MGSFTLKVAGDAGFYSAQEVDLTEGILRGWPQRGRPQSGAIKAKAGRKSLPSQIVWAGQIAGKVRPEVHI